MRTLVLHSGGIDSTTVAAMLVSQGDQVILLHIDYGQVTAATEFSAAKRTANALSLAEPLNIRIPEIGNWGKGSLVSDIEEEEFPHRNLLLISIGAIIAIKEGLETIALGIISSATAPFSDCRYPFIDSCTQTLHNLSPTLELMTPLSHLSKQDVVATAVSLQVPLSMTFSCNRNSNRHCWSCTGCQERASSFKALGVDL